MGFTLKFQMNGFDTLPKVVTGIKGNDQRRALIKSYLQNLPEFQGLHQARVNIHNELDELRELQNQFPIVSPEYKELADKIKSVQEKLCSEEQRSGFRYRLLLGRLGMIKDSIHEYDNQHQ